MRIITTALIILALAAAAAACGDDDGGTIPQPDGPTTLTVEKSLEREPGGELTFTVRVSNTGDNAAVGFDLSDVWQDGIAVSSLGDFSGTRVNAIADRGFDVLLNEFAAGESAEIVYRATCARSGQWTNVATVSADNADPQTTSVSISCP